MSPRGATNGASTDGRTDTPNATSGEEARGALGPDVQPGDSPFLVVGLGASAGGLEALEAFFAGLPQTDGAAFVVVIHLAPERESQLAEILERSVPLPVTQVTERVEVRPGHVYVIPPNRNLVMEDGHLRLTPLEDERHRRRPIDHFFRTLAEAYGEHAVGVVLSGTGPERDRRGPAASGSSAASCSRAGADRRRLRRDAEERDRRRRRRRRGLGRRARPRGHRLRRPAQEASSSPTATAPTATTSGPSSRRSRS